MLELKHIFCYNLREDFPYINAFTRVRSTPGEWPVPQEGTNDDSYYHDSDSITSRKLAEKRGGIMAYLAQFRICNVPMSITNAEIIISPTVNLDNVKHENIGLAIKIAIQLQPIVASLYNNSDYGQGVLNPSLPEEFYERILKDWDSLYHHHHAIDADQLFRDYLRAARRFRDSKAEKRRATNSRPPGYVYLIQSSTGYYKIGRTSNPNDRMKTFNVKLPFEVEYTCVIETPDMFKLERELHQRFAKNRVNGEWFALSSEDVEYIKGLAK